MTCLGILQNYALQLRYNEVENIKAFLRPKKADINFYNKVSLYI